MLLMPQQKNFLKTKTVPVVLKSLYAIDVMKSKGKGRVVLNV